VKWSEGRRFVLAEQDPRWGELMSRTGFRYETAEINKQYPTLLSPNAILLGLYWVVVYALQIGFCLILVTARKDETKVSDEVLGRMGGCGAGRKRRGKLIKVFIAPCLSLAIHKTTHLSTSRHRTPSSME
jgi:hypothetical protein